MARSISGDMLSGRYGLTPEAPAFRGARAASDRQDATATRTRHLKCPVCCCDGWGLNLDIMGSKDIGGSYPRPCTGSRSKEERALPRRKKV
jgi:hypothetical protein